MFILPMLFADKNVETKNLLLTAKLKFVSIVEN